jgi:hypothetical protein
MAPFRWIAGLTGALWRFSRRSWADTGMGLRPRSGASALILFLFLVFFLTGLLLVLLGFDLGRVDTLIDAQSGRIDSVASFLFRAVCSLVFLLCLFTIGASIFDRRSPGRPGAGCALVAALLAYFAWFGVTGD